MVRREAYSLSICTTPKAAEDDGDFADDLVLLLEDGTSGVGTGILIGVGDCERAWLDNGNSGLPCMDSSVPVAPCRGISDGFGKSVKVMSKASRGYDEGEKSQVASSRSNGWLEVVKDAVLEEDDSRFEPSISAVSLLCSELSDADATGAVIYIHGVLLLEQREQVG